MKVVSSSDSGWIARALEHLRSGGVVALPTETVYGFAATLERPEGVERIFALKGRPESRALPWQVDCVEGALAGGFVFGDGALRLARHFWPGPLTLVLERPASCPAWFAPQTARIALRIPNHPVPLALLRAAASPLAVTSANLTGESECLDPLEVREVFGEERGLLLIDGGRAEGGAASTVVETTGAEPAILRDGPIPLGLIEEVWHGRE
jgi:L-threonylcarbamoyladenylate synthase